MSNKIEIKLSTSSQELKLKWLLESEYQRMSVLERIDNYLAEFSDVSVNDKVIFYRLLSTMINAWVEIANALETIKGQVKSPKLVIIIWKIVKRVSWWSALSSSMANFPDVFFLAEIWVIKAWEKSWKLNTILIDLANQIETSALITWKIKGAMIYPVLVIGIVIWALFIIMIFVIPQIKEMFTSMWAELPFITQLLIQWSDFLVRDNFLWTSNWFLVFVMFVLLWFGFQLFKRSKVWSFYFAIFVLRLPIFWNLSQKIAVSKFCSALHLLVSSWISVIDTLKLSSEMIWNEAYRIRILRVVQDVQQWLLIAHNIKNDTLYFPDMLASMIYVWEKTAQLDNISKKIAEYYENEVDTMVRNLMQLFEPLIMVVLGLWVAWMVIAVMLPLLSMSDIVS